MNMNDNNELCKTMLPTSMPGAVRIERPTWDQIWFTATYLFSKKSDDINTHSGCVIISQDNDFLAMGFNGLPRKIKDGIDQYPERYDREKEKYFWMEHAERNAIYNATRNSITLKDSIVYVNWTPCVDCAKAIIQSGIKTVKIHLSGQRLYDSNNNSKGADYKHSIVFKMFEEASVKYDFYNTQILNIDALLNNKNYEVKQINEYGY